MNAQTSHSGHRQRLRAKFLTAGKEALADYELLELLLFAASPRRDTKPLAKALIAEFGSLPLVIKADIKELENFNGLGEAGIAALKLHKAIAEELIRHDVTINKTVLDSWKKLLDYCKLAISDERKEEFRMLFLNMQNELIADKIGQTGTINHVMVYPREVVKMALEYGAAAVILVHNHPSGDPTPSQSDITMTQKIKQALIAVDIRLHDHLVIGNDEHYSFASYGIL